MTNTSIIYIYTLKCPIKNEIFYVGKTINLKDRYSKHCHPTKRTGKKLYGYLKYLNNKKIKPIMEILDLINDDDWGWLEKYWISQIKSWGITLLNCTNGGEYQYHYHHTNETKKKISEKQCGRKLTKEWCKNIGNGKRGVKFSESHISNISKSLKGKNNISAQKKIFQLDNNFKIINEFNSITEALKSLNKNIKDGSISRVCKGSLKSAYGYHWCYVNDYKSLDINNFTNKRKKGIIKIDIVSEEIVMEYNSLNEAASDNNCHYTSISHVCNKLKGSVNGFIFVFKKDYSPQNIDKIKKTIRKQKNGVYWNN